MNGRRCARASGAPVVSIDLPEPEALGAEFIRWRSRQPSPEPSSASIPSTSRTFSRPRMQPTCCSIDSNRMERCPRRRRPDSGPRCGADADERRQAGPCSPRGDAFLTLIRPHDTLAPCVSGTGPCALRGPPPVSGCRFAIERARPRCSGTGLVTFTRRGSFTKAAEHRRLHSHYRRAARGRADSLSTVLIRHSRACPGAWRFRVARRSRAPRSARELALTGCRASGRRARCVVGAVRRAQR